jgi:hypothetical protein
MDISFPSIALALISHNRGFARSRVVAMPCKNLLEVAYLFNAFAGSHNGAHRTSVQLTDLGSSGHAL